MSAVCCDKVMTFTLSVKSQQHLQFVKGIVQIIMSVLNTVDGGQRAPD